VESAGLLTIRAAAVKGVRSCPGLDPNTDRYVHPTRPTVLPVCLAGQLTCMACLPACRLGLSRVGRANWLHSQLHVVAHLYCLHLLADRTQHVLATHLYGLPAYVGES
jgi:hypothetical protein